MTAPRRIPAPRFGATVTNHLASEDNPTRVGYFVRVSNGSWLMTDGRRSFWTVRPTDDVLANPDAFPHLSVDRSTELPGVAE